LLIKGSKTHDSVVEVSGVFLNTRRTTAMFVSAA
jgi:hypothetical protein